MNKETEAPNSAPASARSAPAPASARSAPASASARARTLTQISAHFTAWEFYAAEPLARSLLMSNAEDEEALLLLAQILNRQGRINEALKFMRQLLELNSFNSVYHNDYGVMLGAMARWAEAEVAHRLSSAIDGRNPDARFNLAISLFRQDKSKEALLALDDLHRVAPDFAEGYALRGEILCANQRNDEAITALSKAVEKGLETPAVLTRLGAALLDTGERDEALYFLSKSNDFDAKSAAASFYLGRLAREKDDLHEAVKHYREAVKLEPDFAEAYNNLGLALKDLGDHSAAEAAFNKAVSIAPDLGAAHVNMSNTLLKQGRMAAALSCLEKAAEATPEFPAVWNNLGDIYTRQRRFDEAEAAFRKALAIDANCIEADCNLGLLLLLRGEFKEGWRRYEKRWERPKERGARPQFSVPEWAGESLNGKSLLIYLEQGLGDNIQFVRYLAVLRERYPDARFYYSCYRALFRLFAPYLAHLGVEVLPQKLAVGMHLPSADYQVGLLSLPHCLETTLETIPASVPYLQVNAALSAEWHNRLLQLAGANALNGKKIGIVWSGGEIYASQQLRSMQLQQLKPLFELPGITWISLQKGAPSAQIIEQNLTQKILDPMSEVEDLADTAAIIANLDLVISVDTAVLHLAGALNKPVWLLDRFSNDWRWLQEREDSPWYPSLRIFRQAEYGDWRSVVAGVEQALKA